MYGTRTWGVATVVVSLGLWACGGERNEASGPSMAVPTGIEEAPARALNAAPEIESVRLQPPRPTAGDRVRAVVQASDEDGDPLRLHFEWELNGEPLDANGERATLKGARKGALLEVSVTASDGRAESAPTRVTARIGNRKPNLSGITIRPPGQLVGGDEVIVEPVAHDRDGDRLRFDYAWRVNGRRQMHEGPVFPTAGLRRGSTIQVSVTAHDGQDASITLDSPVLEVGNAPPKIDSRLAADASSTDEFRYQVEAVDPDGDHPLRYKLAAAPDGMTVSSTRGEIVWAPTEGQEGRHVVMLEVDDLHGGVAQQRFEVIVGLEDPPEAQQAETAPANAR